MLARRLLAWRLEEPWPLSSLKLLPITRRSAAFGGLAAAGAALLSGCANSLNDSFSSAPAPSQPAPTATIGTGQVKVGMILPLSAAGNAALAAQSMRNAAELAVTEFSATNIQLLIKDDAGSAQGAAQAAQQAMDEGAEIILGPLFAQSVQAVSQVTRARGVPVIAFSTDASVASRGTYLLSFLPESDVDRIVSYSVSTGKRSFAALLPESAYGSVTEAAFKEAVSRRSGRIVALERYQPEAAKLQEPVRIVAQAANQADAIFIPDGPDVVPNVVQAIVAGGVTKKVQYLGTGLWADDPRIFQNASLHGALYAAPDSSGFSGFAGRYKSRYGQEPVRTATLSYDATALVIALVKTQGAQRFSDDVLTNPSGFNGIDGIFRFRSDGLNQRGLAVLRVTPSGAQVASAAPKSFSGSAT